MERGKNPKSLANLRQPIKPGEVRNPTGINVKRPASDEYWRASGEPIPLEIIRRFNRKCGAKLLKPGDTWARGVAIRLEYNAVMEGLVYAAKEMREAMEGRSPQRLEISARPSKVETVIVIKFEDRKGNRYDTREALFAAQKQAEADKQPKLN